MGSIESIYSIFQESRCDSLTYPQIVNKIALELRTFYNHEKVPLKLSEVEREKNLPKIARLTVGFLNRFSCNNPMTDNMQFCADVLFSLAEQDTRVLAMITAQLAMRLSYYSPEYYRNDNGKLTDYGTSVISYISQKLMTQLKTLNPEQKKAFDSSFTIVRGNLEMTETPVGKTITPHCIQSKFKFAGMFDCSSLTTEDRQKALEDDLHGFRKASQDLDDLRKITSYISPIIASTQKFHR